MNELAPGIWRWTARHPEWHPKWGARVASFLVDPLIEDFARARPADRRYHVRSATDAVARWGGVVLGHPNLRKRLGEATPFAEGVPGEALPALAAEPWYHGLS